MTIWLAYALAALAASVLFIIAGWRSRAVAASGATRHAWVPETTGSLNETPSSLARDESVGNAAEAIDVALRRLRPLIQANQARIDVVAGPDLFARMRVATLADLTSDLLTLGLDAVPGGQFLLTASRRGDRVEITLSDDGFVEDASFRRSRSRELAQSVALHGGSLEVVDLARQGTSTTLRLAGAFAQPGEAAAHAPPETAAQLL